MKMIVCALLALSSFAAAPGITLASTDSAVVCSPDVPEAMKRPGGYCDQIKSTDNIGTERDKGPARCVTPVDYRPLLRRGITVTVADVDYCCQLDGEAVLPGNLPDGLLSRTDAVDRMQLARVCITN